MTPEAVRLQGSCDSYRSGSLRYMPRIADASAK